MSKTFPGTTVEVISMKKGSSRQIFDGIFAAGGITLSQVCVMTGLEPYLIQNWVKRGFVSSPKKRLYSREQLSRIIIINMLRETLQIEKICALIKAIGTAVDSDSVDEELYHRYVDMISGDNINISDEASVTRAIKGAISDLQGSTSDFQKQLISIFKIMFYAHAATILKQSAEEMLSTVME